MLRSATAALLLLASSSAAVHAADERTLQIIVSKQTQTVSVYDDGQIIAQSHVSTGKPGHDTPTGIFSILEKRKYHRSNIYSNAPMPWMQRLTWSGIALHESSSVPNRPASHGCVRLPADFAKSLYQLTSRGVHVIISNDEVKPIAIEHAFLFQPAASPQPTPLLSDVPLRPSATQKDSGPVEVAMINLPNKPEAPGAAPTTAVKANDAPPLRILITRRNDRDLLRDIQTMLNDLGFDAGTSDGIAGQQTIAAIKAYKAEKSLDTKEGLLSESFIASLFAAAGKQPPPAGQLMIRQNFQPVLSEPVEIKSPEQALGTHFYQLVHLDEQGRKANWQGLSLANRLPDATKKRLGITLESPIVADSAKAALDRIVLPDDLRHRIEAMLSAGTSLTITDNGPSQETTEGTDFITITR